MSVIVALLLLQDARELTEALRSDDVTRRDEAASKLRALGPAAVEELKRAAKDADAEVAARASRVLRLIELDGTLSPELRVRVAGIVERLAGDDHEWTRVLLEVGAQTPIDRRGPADLSREDLMPLAARAVRGAADEDELESVMVMVQRMKLHDAVPVLRSLLKHSSHKVRHQALEALHRLDASEAVDDVRSLLHDEAGPVVREALFALADWGVRLPAAEVVSRLIESRADGDHYGAGSRLCGRAPLIQALCGMLGDEKEGVRLEAAVRLQAIDARGINALLTPHLDDKSERVREIVEELLADGRSETLRATLLTRLSSSDDETRVRAVRLLSRYADASVARAIEDLAADRHPAVRALVAGFDGTGVLALRILVKDADENVRHAALKSIAARAHRDLAPEVVERLADANSRVREAAIKALEVVAPERTDLFVKALGDSATAHAVRWHLMLFPPSSEGALLYPLLGSKSAEERAAAISALESLRAPGVEQQLLRMAGDPSPEVRSALARVFEEMPGDATAAALRKLLRDEAADVRQAAMKALGRSGDRAILLRLLEDPSARTRLSAAEALADMGDRAALPVLRAAMGDEDAAVRESAVSAAFELDAATATRDVVALLKNERASVRYHALRALARHAEHARAVVSDIAKALGDADWEVRVRAAATLKAAGGADAVAALRRALGDRNVYVRATAADALGELRSDAAVDELRALLSRADREERLAVASALVELGCDDGAADVSRALESRDRDVRTRVVEMLARARTWTDRLRAVVRDDVDARVRRLALAALVAQDAEGNLETLLGALGDLALAHDAMKALRRLPASRIAPRLRALRLDAERRDYALRTLIALGDAEAVRDGLRHSLPVMQSSALESVGDLRLEVFADEVRALARSPDMNVCMFAARALALLGGDKAADALRPLLRHPSVFVRLAGAEALCRAGYRDGVTVLFEESHRWMAPGPDAMNALRRPDAVRKLAAVRSGPSEKPTIRSLVEAAGFRLMVESRRDLPSIDGGTWDRCFRRWEGAGGVSAIVEDDAVRIVDREVALKFWREWWAAENKK